MRRRCTKRKDARGFALLVVVLIVALLAATVTLALREATSGLAAVGGAKSAELVYADIAGGLSQAFQTLTMTDARDVVAVAQTQTYDIFNPCAIATPSCHPGSPFVLGSYLQPQTTAPTAGAGSVYAIPIMAGMRAGQRTNPPPGEDVRTTYGFVVEVQLQADVDTNDARNGGAVPAQERVSVGVRIPLVQSGSNN